MPALFKPGQAPSTGKALSAGKAQHRAAEQSQPADFSLGIDAYAEQERSQQLKLKQAAVKAENELDRLKSLLQREQALQVLCNLSDPHNNSQYACFPACLSALGSKNAARTLAPRPLQQCACMLFMAQMGHDALQSMQQLTVNLSTLLRYHEDVHIEGLKLQHTNFCKPSTLCVQAISDTVAHAAYTSSKQCMPNLLLTRCV